MGLACVHRLRCLPCLDDEYCMFEPQELHARWFFMGGHMDVCYSKSGPIVGRSLKRSVQTLTIEAVRGRVACSRKGIFNNEKVRSLAGRLCLFTCQLRARGFRCQGAQGRSEDLDLHKACVMISYQSARVLDDILLVLSVPIQHLGSPVDGSQSCHCHPKPE